MKTNIFNLFYFFILLLTGSHGLKDVKIKVPPAAQRGSRVVLECRYDLEGDMLYTVKWYKGGHEFFRFTPKENPMIKYFPIYVLNVNEDLSNDTHVIIDRVSREHSGQYDCEISADAPSFFTKISTGILEVVDLPEKDPVIEGLKVHYKVGETLKATCKCANARPAVNLTWYVNQRREDTRIHKHKPQISQDGEFLTASSSLQLQVTKQLFLEGNLKIRCTATMFQLYYKVVEKTVYLERKKRHKNNHQRTYYHSDGLSSTFSPLQPSLIDREMLGLPAQRNPETTLIWVSEIENEGNRNGFNAAGNLLLLLLICLTQTHFR